MALPLVSFHKCFCDSWLISIGDPYSDSVILWTRISPMQANVNSNATVSGWVPLYNHGPAINSSFVTTAPICVQYKVARTADFAVVESSGTAYTSSDIDYTVKVCSHSIYGIQDSSKHL